MLIYWVLNICDCSHTSPTCLPHMTTPSQVPIQRQLVSTTSRQPGVIIEQTFYINSHIWRNIDISIGRTLFSSPLPTAPHMTITEPHQYCSNLFHVKVYSQVQINNLCVSQRISQFIMNEEEMKSIYFNATLPSPCHPPLHGGHAHHIDNVFVYSMQSCVISSLIVFVKCYIFTFAASGIDFSRVLPLLEKTFGLNSMTERDVTSFCVNSKPSKTAPTTFCLAVKI